MKARELEHAVVVVTGASSGAGRACALAFAANRARVVLAARDDAELEQVAAQCRDLGAEAIAAPFEAADVETVERVRQRAVDAFGRIDVWVHAAAVLVVAPFGRETVRELDRLVDVNVRGYLYGARVALEQFRLQRSGTLILVSSLLGIIPSPAAPAYSMSKFAVRGLALSLRQSVVGYPGISVSTIMPGPIDTPMFENAANHSGRGLRAVPPAYAPERVAATVVACARRPRRQMTVGVGMRLVLALHHVAPRATELAVAQTSARLLLRRDAAPDTPGALFEPPASPHLHGGWRRGRLRSRAGESLGRHMAARS